MEHIEGSVVEVESRNTKLFVFTEKLVFDIMLYKGDFEEAFVVWDHPTIVSSSDEEIWYNTSLI